MTPEMAMQKAIITVLAASSDLTAMVPSDNILDRNERPNPDPAIVVGEGQSISGDDIARKSLRVIFDVHVFKKEAGLGGVKTIAGMIRGLLAGRPALDAGFQCGDCYVSQVRFLRDPDMQHSHAVVTVEALVMEVV